MTFMQILENEKYRSIVDSIEYLLSEMKRDDEKEKILKFQVLKLKQLTGFEYKY